MPRLVQQRNDVIMQPDGVGENKRPSRGAISRAIGTRCFSFAVDAYGTLRGPHILVLGKSNECYATAFGSIFSGAQVSISDHEAPTRIAHELSSNSCETRCRRLLYDDLGGPYDIVFISGLLDEVSIEDGRRLLRRIHEALLPGGAVIIGTKLLGAVYLAPAFAVAYNLSYWPENEARQFKPSSEITTLLDDAGFYQHEPIGTRIREYECYEFIVGHK